MSNRIDDEVKQKLISMGDGLEKLADSMVGVSTAVTRVTEGLIKLSHALEKPVDMILYCPECGTQHIDKPDPSMNWLNPPHRKHLCLYCGHLWKPSYMNTNGVLVLREIDSDDYTGEDDG